MNGHVLRNKYRSVVLAEEHAKMEVLLAVAEKAKTAQRLQ